VHCSARLCRPDLRKASEAVKKQRISRKDANAQKVTKHNHFAFFAPLREMLLLVEGLFHSFRGLLIQFQPWCAAKDVGHAQQLHGHHRGFVFVETCTFAINRLWRQRASGWPLRHARDPHLAHSTLPLVRESLLDTVPSGDIP